jgi:bifunctional DNA-binding transcriptional regulator/antitoxin component of YhaV-PrlF toxin-antitoxin module
MIAKLDGKGRLVVPKSKRDSDEFKDGDIFVVDPNSAAGTITFVKIESPLLRHLAESRAGYEAGLGLTLEELAAELGVDLGSE